MSESLKTGIIGLGILGSEYAHFLQEHPAAEVVAVADVRAEAAEKVAAEVGAQAYADYREMLRREPTIVAGQADEVHAHDGDLLGAALGHQRFG